MKIQSSWQFSPEQKRNALIWLSIWHILVILSSNYLVQFPFSVGKFHTTWGAFTFPFIFLTTDLTVRIFGRTLAQKIIFVVMLPALLLSYAVSVIVEQGKWIGLHALFAPINMFVLRIALASFGAYLFGQLMDIIVFNRLRQAKQWWIAPSASTVLGNGLDTIIFFFIAFYQSSDPFMAEHWVQLGLADYAWKLLISLCLFLPAYGYLLRILIKRLTTLSQKISQFSANGSFATE